MKRRLNNKGFTLVELIIAMTILAIIVVPLLRAFVIAAITNTKASKAQRATNCAQNFIETLKSTTVSDMALSVYNYTTDAEGNAVVSFPVSSFTGKDAAGSAATIRAFEATIGAAGQYAQTTTPCVTAATQGGDFQGPTTEGDQLCFIFPNVAQNNRYYDLVLELTAGKTASEAKLNSVNLANCIYLAQHDNLADEAAYSFETANAAYANTPGVTTMVMNKSQFEQKMTRTITLEITGTGDSVMVTMTTDFDCGAGYTSSDKRHYIITETSVHDNSDGEMAGIYLFYYPLYGNGASRDTFIVNNRENLDVDLFLVAMENSDYTTSNMDSYRAKITVNERLIQSEYQGASARTGIHTGLMSNVPNSRWSINDNNTSVTTSMKPLGESSEGTYMYRMNVLVYEHDDDAFRMTDGKACFTAAEKNYITSFDGSALD